MTVNQRIKEARHKLELSQAKFAKGISISNGYIAGIELGNRKVNDRIIRLICVEYGVSESWLKTGKGQMFDQPPGENLDKVLAVFKELNPEFQEYVLQQIQGLLDVQKAQTDPEKNPVGKTAGTGAKGRIKKVGGSPQP